MTVIQHISFDPEGVEISFLEEDDVKHNGLRLYRTAIVPRNLVGAELQELEDAALALLDQVEVARRQPADSFSRRR